MDYHGVMYFMYSIPLVHLNALAVLRASVTLAQPCCAGPTASIWTFVVWPPPKSSTPRKTHALVVASEA